MAAMLRAFFLALAAFASTVALAQGTVEVSIEQYKFAPQDLKVKAGTTVKWTNNEKRASHSVLFPAEGGRESDRMMPGDSWQRTFDKPGTYRYTCGPHPEMSGLVEVTE
jgi:plastocyanin